MHNNKVGQLEDDIMTKARRLVFALWVYIYSGSNIILLMDILHILGEYLNIFSGYIEIMRIQRNLSEYVYYINQIGISKLKVFKILNITSSLIINI